MSKVDLEHVCAQLSTHPSVVGRAKFFNSAVLLPLVARDGEYDVVFEKRSAQVRQGGEVCFPGGKIEPECDAHSQATAVRETCEELGVDPARIHVLGALGTLVTAMGVAVDAYVGTLDISGVEALAIQTSEVAEVFTVPLRWFCEHPPQTYHARLDIQPSATDDKGQNVELFPAARLGLPERYTRPWGGKVYPIYVYETPQGVIWGITAELLHEFVRKIVG